MTFPAVSVIVPTYNCAQFIKGAIHSVLTQTTPVKEIIVVDDGSTDNTSAAVSSLPDDRIIYRRFPNAGASVARNRGLDIANGEFIAFLDADDLWRPAMIENQLALMTINRDIVCSFTNFIRFLNETGTHLSDQFAYYPELKTVRTNVIASAFPTLIMFGEIPAFTQVMMFRRDAVCDLRFDPTLRICEDAAFALQVFAKGSVAFSSEVLAEVRVHEESATFGRVAEMPLHKLAALLSIANTVKDCHKKPYRERLVKAYIDASLTCVATGNRRHGIQLLTESLSVPGNLARKVKGAIRFAVAASQKKKPCSPSPSRGSEQPRTKQVKV